MGSGTPLGGAQVRNCRSLRMSPLTVTFHRGKEPDVHINRLPGVASNRDSKVRARREAILAVPQSGGRADRWLCRHPMFNINIESRMMRVRSQLAACSASSDRLFEHQIFRSAKDFATPLNVPTHLIQMLLLIEDKRFGVHPGVDPISIMRAFSLNLLGGDLQGASTITQQLYDVRNMESDNGYSRPRTLHRKLNQAAWSIRRELLSTKVEILNEYISKVYWGNNYFGIDSASEGYFGTRRFELTAAESFFLAEKLASPNRTYVKRVEALLERSAVRYLVNTDSSVSDVWALYARSETVVSA